MVTRVEPEAGNVKLGRLFVDVGVREKRNEARAAVSQHAKSDSSAKFDKGAAPSAAKPPRGPVRRGVSDEAVEAAKAGVKEGVVDFAYEPRYGKGTKSIADGSSWGTSCGCGSPPIARTPRGIRSRWRWSSGRRRRWW